MRTNIDRLAMAKVLSRKTLISISRFNVVSSRSCGDNGGSRVKVGQAAMCASERKPALAAPNNAYCGLSYAKTVGRRERDPNNYKGTRRFSVTSLMSAGIMGSRNRLYLT